MALMNNSDYFNDIIDIPKTWAYNAAGNAPESGSSADVNRRSRNQPLTLHPI